MTQGSQAGAGCVPSAKLHPTSGLSIKALASRWVKKLGKQTISFLNVHTGSRIPQEKLRDHTVAILANTVYTGLAGHRDASLV